MLEAMQAAAEVRSKALAVRDVIAELEERLIELVDQSRSPRASLSSSRRTLGDVLAREATGFTAVP
jgi:hypothetical protein